VRTEFLNEQLVTRLGPSGPLTCEGLGVTMNAFVTAVLIGAALLAVAIWVEVRERRSAPGDGNYRSSGPPRS
jgi:hypothetical protein